ncbi:MAG TPA: PIG-L deacetylase family protein [Thermoguttaceae bacterium]|nr:PIG-L deacetylase family protein [Thermoguttaceae bacterium]
MSNEPLRLLILGAHPDDSEYHAGGLAAIYRGRGHLVRMVSVTNGGAGHHEKPPEEVAGIRRREAAAAGQVLGAAYETWDFPDGELMPTLDVRHRIIAEIRSFAPDLVLTHRTNDYHPDHRAVGQAVQDASFLVTVPHVVPEVPPLRRDPVVAYMVDLFTKPCPLVPDVAIDVTDQIDTIVSMLACHGSQVFQWLPYLAGVLDQVPGNEAERRAWLREWFTRQVKPRADRFREALVAAYGPERGSRIEYAEVYEVSEYAAAADDETRRRLFPRAK